MTATDNLDTLLQDLDAELGTRLEAQSKLVTYGAGAVQPLIRLLREGSLKQIAVAIPTLAQIGDPRAIDPLIDILHTGQHSLLWMNAAQALAAFNDPAVVEALLVALDAQDEVVLTWVVDSLAALGDRRAVDPLITLLNQNPSAEIRYMVIRALGDLGDVRAVEPIRRFLSDDDHHVQSDAISALEKLTQGDNRLTRDQA